MYFIKSLIPFLLFLAPAFAFGQATYRFKLDLRDVKDDRLKVELITPTIKSENITYYLPKIVPGTYTVYDFGRFVRGFKAFDQAGNLLTSDKTGENGWKIKNASRLYRITYLVDDTWDSENDNFVFEPAGTNIEANKAFVLNNYGFFGYFNGMEDLAYELEIKKPVGFFGATSMDLKATNDSTDFFKMPNYHELADAPILYTIPDTAKLLIGGAEILISVYSPNKTVSSKFVAKNISELLEAQKSFLGGSFPIKKYAFLIYLTEGLEGSGYQGALEHSYSSLYFLPEMPDEEILLKELAQEIRDVAAHEFFHIITPLNIHSTEIHNFNFSNPKMSKHLWLYEGVVEYFSSLMQVQYGLLSEEEYILVLQDKLKFADDYRQDISFTELSLKCLDKHIDEYGNVYEKGALIGLSLDLLLMDLTDGEYRLTDLLDDLAKKYGKNNPFKDNVLFGEIQEITGQKDIAEFLRKHVGGTKPLPLEKLFRVVGYNYSKEKKEKRITMGNVALGIDKGKKLVVRSIEGMNKFGKRLGYKVNDVILSIDKEEIDSMEKAISVLTNFQQTAKSGKKFRVRVLRKNKKGIPKEKVLKARLIAEEVPVLHVIEPIKKLNERQQKMKAIWLRK
jgi:predicted metalloprotease with PDZ domain